MRMKRTILALSLAVSMVVPIAGTVYADGAVVYENAYEESVYTENVSYADAGSDGSGIQPSEEPTTTVAEEPTEPLTTVEEPTTNVSEEPTEPLTTVEEPTTTAAEEQTTASEETTTAEDETEAAVIINNIEVEAKHTICRNTHGQQDGSIYKYTDYNFFDETTQTYNLEYTISYTENKEQKTFVGNSYDIYQEFAVYPELVELGTVEDIGKLTIKEKLLDQEYTFEIEIVEHTIEIDAAVEATCASTGLTEGSHCSVCGTVIVKQEVVPLKEHTVVIDEGKPATYEESGLTEGSHCSVCNKVIVEQYVIPALSEDGWHDIGDNRYYYQDGQMVSGWKYIDGNWYYFDSECRMTKGWIYVDTWYYMNTEGVMLSGWQNIDGEKYYFGESGRMRTGWQVIDTNWYYFSMGGKMRAGWQYIDDNWYYLGSDGRMAYGGWQYIDNDWYYLGAGGKMWYGWQYLDDNWYYLGAGGKMKTGWQYINKNWYYFGAGGKMWYGGWVIVDNDWYYLTSGGRAVTGWQYLKGSWYYMNAGGRMITGWREVDGETYYMDANGKMLTGWQKINGETYYFSNSGKLGSGDHGWYFNKNTGYWFYYDSNNNMLISKWLQLDGNWYYLSWNGVKLTGWYKINGYYYFFDSNGIMQEGLITDSEGYYYYLYPGSGKMARYTELTIDGNRYYFDYNGYGIKVTNGTETSMTALAQRYWSQTDYLIMIDCSANRFGVYKWNYSTSRWDLYKFWACTTGAPSTKTVKGQFTVNFKGYSFDAYSSTCYYYSSFYGPYYIHSILYEMHSWDVMDARLGMSLSHGCVRLSTNNAYWVYTQIPYGTKVVAY